MVVRKFPRFPVAMPSTLVQRDKLRYNASVKDLSLKGCRLESVVRPFTGMQVELLIELPGEPTPIHISRGTVRWSGSGTCPPWGSRYFERRSSSGGPRAWPTATAAALARAAPKR